MSLELSGTTGVKGVAGSVSAPSIVGDDTNTGISFPAADTIKFSTGGVERMSITNSGISGISPGIAMADQWRTYNTQSIGANSAPIITSWERNDNTFAGIGSAMNESSGVFTFPSTGIYLVMYNFSFYLTSGNSRYISPRMFYNGNRISISFTHINHISTETFGNAGNQAILDVTDTSHELKFAAVSNSAFIVVGNNWEGVGNENVNTSFVTFLRLGDT